MCRNALVALTKTFPNNSIKLASLEILHRFSVLLRSGFGLERAEIPTLPGLRIFFREYNR
jgi:hypothetical protein